MTAPITVAEGVRWVGTLDPKLAVFDLVMRTENGTTYNAYLVEGRDHVALVDATKRGFEGELLGRIAACVDPARIDYIIVNHTEPDHAGGLAEVLAAAPGATILGTNRAIAFVGELLNRPLKTQVVKAGGELDLGGKTLRFLPAPFIHWPDTMMTYLVEDRLLFSCDLFGSHYCTAELFDDTLGDAFLPDFHRYYDAIMGPFSGHVRKALEKLDGLSIDAICPSHGPVLRRDPQRYVALYRQWSAVREGRPRVLLGYASVYGFTGALAAAVARGLLEAGVDATVLDLAEVDAAAAGEAAWGADAIVLGSPTINGGPAPQVLALLAYLDPFRAKGKRFAAFGSYGWSGEAPAILKARAEELKMVPVGEGLLVAFAPKDEDLAAAEALGRQVAAAVLA